MASTADRTNGPGPLSPTGARGTLVQPQQAAAVYEHDLVQHAIKSWKRAQPWIRNNNRRTAHEPLNLALDLEHARVAGHSR